MSTSGKLRSMATVYLTCGDQILLLYRQGSSVVADAWVGSAGGHFEPEELCDARACVLRELREELGLEEQQIERLALRYVVLRRTEKEIRPEGQTSCFSSCRSFIMFLPSVGIFECTDSIPLSTEHLLKKRGCFLKKL